MNQSGMGWQVIWIMMRKGFISGMLSLCFVVQSDAALETVAVSERNYPKTVIFDAVVEAVHNSTISSRISAEVIEINYDVNDVVPKGAVIMRFRDEEFQARVAQIKAGLLADKAQQQEAKARQKEAASEFTRVNNLFKRKLLAQADLDRAKANLSAANARVKALQAQVKSRQAQLNEALVQLSYTVIKAPYSGVVTARYIELGEIASPGQHLMSGISLEALRAIVQVPQYMLADIQAAKQPILHLTDGRKIQGQKITVIPQADVRSHSFRLRIDLPPGITALYPGTYGKMTFVVGKEMVRVIPQTAIVQRSEVSGVYVLHGKQIVLRQIRLGRKREDGMREVLAGLSVGEKVILDPVAAAIQLKENSAGTVQ